MSSTDERLTELEKKLAVVEARLKALEGVQIGPDTEVITADSGTKTSFSEQLLKRLPPAEQAHEAVGLIAYAGAIRAEEGELAWDFERKVQDLLQLELEPIAQVLAACGSVPRLELVRLLLRGPQNSQQLQEALGISSGPLYYHLKELMAVGIVSQPTRNSYQVAAPRIVPFLALLVAALDVRSS